ncbi:phage portal protein [Dorea formicigenerans]|uniref:Phage portal protein n=2 Tax=Dorea formicigenerans TaxID=39486 RepID=A0A848CFV2_9FIRM|nr:phage portal protein [Dorea formicigenerans]
MNEKVARQIEEMKKQTIGVEVEMNNITREKAAKVAARYFGTRRYENTAGRNGYSTWSAWDAQGREWKFQKDVSIEGLESEKCEMVTPILTYSDMETLQELIRQLRHAGAKSDATRGCGVHIHIGAKGHTPQTLRNLANIMASHESLIADALNLDRGRMRRYCRTVDPRFLEQLNRRKPTTMTQLADIWYGSHNANYGRSHHYNDSRYVLHIPGLGFDGLVGYSPIAMAKNAIGMAIACEEYGAKFFANGATPGGILEHPGTVKDPAKVRDSWNEAFGGSRNSNKVAVLEEGMKYTPISISPEQAQFLETRKFQIDEIARIFRVPPHMVGDLEKSSFSNIEQQSLEFVKYTLEPWIVRWEQSINRVLLMESEKAAYFVKFNVDGLLRGDYQSRMNGYATARQNGWMSANDIRELENLDRIPAEQGGDLYLINGNMTKLEDAGIFAADGGGKEEESDEEVLEVEEPDGSESGDTGADTGEDAVSKRHHRRGKLV